MAWVVLIIAGLCEVGWAIGLKYTDGFSAQIIFLLMIVVGILGLKLSVT